ncbi:MAG: hypothetical protein FJX34_02595, partial [Alphaproteobacteria bacterium]|nr:hypothetical protein [Alphaproteobacteria bacterium]
MSALETNPIYRFVKKHNISKILFVACFVGLAAISYFVFFMIFGDKGLVKFFALKQQIENKEINKQELSAKMQEKKNLVKGMSLDSLDLDLVDEQSRKVLGYAGKNEVVIYQKSDG